MDVSQLDDIRANKAYSDSDSSQTTLPGFIVYSTNSTQPCLVPLTNYTPLWAFTASHELGTFSIGLAVTAVFHSFVHHLHRELSVIVEGINRTMVREALLLHPTALAGYTCAPGPPLPEFAPAI